MGTTILRTILNRIYADFFMPSRLGVYREFLEEIISHGYKTYSVATFWEKTKGDRTRLQENCLVLRHDIDTDTGTAKAMWEIEQALGVESSYYFRLSTVDIPFMRAIAFSRGEAGYHYEELATVAKEKCLKTREQVLREMPCIRRLFQENLNSLRERSGLPIDIVASHGDFVNRKLQMYNWEILKNNAFRKEVGVKLEVYDEPFASNVSSRHSDTDYPSFWRPESPLGAIRRGESVIYVLVHPRHWRTNHKVNFVDNVNRALEGLRYSL